MAIDNRLQVFNEEGQSVDYDILASDVKFFPDGKDLPTKLAELEQEIEDAGSGDGTVTGVKVGSTTHEPTEGVVDLSEPFNDKVDKETGKVLIPSTDLAKLQNLPTADELTQQMGAKANDNVVVKSISVNGTAQQKDQQGNVNIQVQAGDQVSVIQPDPADGTFIIRVGSTDYTINLNHTHEGMAKLEKVTEATLPQTFADDTIYVQVDDVTTPQAIEALYIFGLEFTGGGVAPGTPVITKPSGTTINLGENDGSGVEGTITVMGKSLTGDLTVSVAQNSGLSLSYGQLTGQSSVTIDQADAEAVAGAVVTVAYSGSGTLDLADGLSISGGGAQTKYMKVVVTEPAPIELGGVEFTGTQWLRTDYYPNPLTEFEMEVKFTANSNTDSTSAITGLFREETYLIEGGVTYRFYMVNTKPASQGDNRAYQLQFAADRDVDDIGSTSSQLQSLDFSNERNAFTSDHSKISYSIGETYGVFTFTPGSGTAKSRNVFKKTKTQDKPLDICYRAQSNEIYNIFNLTVYRLKIMEGGVVVRDYVPREKNGVAGLLDVAENGTGLFLTSETAKTSGLSADELVAIPLNSSNS